MSVNSKWYFEVDEADNNAIKIYDGENEAPFIYQPHWPDGTPWASKAEATAWAEAKVGESDNDNPVMAGISPSQPTLPKPTQEDLRLARLHSTGLTVDDLKALLGL
jgi:hypothetical protein